MPERADAGPDHRRSAGERAARSWWCRFSDAHQVAESTRSGGDVKYVICNGDEGDPGAFMDRMLLESFPYRSHRRDGDRRAGGRSAGSDLLHPRGVSVGREADSRSDSAV